jgi:sugar phosphate isomerase/epimerase
VIAFATLGCPGLPLEEVIALASAHGCTGVEFRYADGEPVHPGLSTSEIQAVGRRLTDAGITPVALDSYVRVAAEGPADEEVVADLHRHIEVAAVLGAGFVRVFPGGGEPKPAVNERAARRLAAVADAAREAGVGVLLETHDSHRRGQDAARVLSRAAELSGLSTVDGTPLGAIWDVMHTWLGGETPTESAVALAPWLGYVQLKDIPGPEDRTPVAPGAGVLPLRDVLAELRQRDYSGWVSLEYERAWHPEIPPLADILPTFTEYLTRHA